MKTEQIIKRALEEFSKGREYGELEEAFANVFIDRLLTKFGNLVIKGYEGKSNTSTSYKKAKRALKRLKKIYP